MTDERQADPKDNGPRPVEKATFNEFDGLPSQQQAAPISGAGKKGSAMGDMSLDMIMDVSVSVSVEVGRAKMSIRELRDLKQGAIVELDRAAGTPLDVMVNGTLVARGEVVVIKDKYGIMLTEVVSQDERGRR